jgi:AhpD family alkylhydroperoxidase
MFLVHFNSASEAYKDIEQTLGLVPKFFTLFPEEGIAGAWSEFKGLQLNPYTALNGKQKELIGLSVAAQIPCEYCIYFHRSAAYLNGATDREINEAIANAALTRHWSAILNGAQIELEKFKSDADRMLKAGQRQQLHS